MGLDQYANWTDGTKDEDGCLIQNEFKYWRKTSHIQNFFQKIWAEQTGIVAESAFNCEYVEITKEILDKFVEAVKNKEMQPVDGFFFGSTYDPSNSSVIEDDLRFAADCFFHLSMGRKVFYTSWW